MIIFLLGITKTSSPDTEFECALVRSSEMPRMLSIMKQDLDPGSRIQHGTQEKCNPGDFDF